MFTVLTYFSRETIKVLGQSPILINTLFVPLVFLFASFCIETLVFYSKSFFFYTKFIVMGNVEFCCFECCSLNSKTINSVSPLFSFIGSFRTFVASLFCPKLFT